MTGHSDTCRSTVANSVRSILTHIFSGATKTPEHVTCVLVLHDCPTLGNCSLPAPNTPLSAPIALGSAPWLACCRIQLLQHHLLLPHRRPQMLSCRLKLPVCRSLWSFLPFRAAWVPGCSLASPLLGALSPSPLPPPPIASPPLLAPTLRRPPLEVVGYPRLPRPQKPSSRRCRQDQAVRRPPRHLAHPPLGNHSARPTHLGPAPTAPQSACSARHICSSCSSVCLNCLAISTK